VQGSATTVYVYDAQGQLAAEYATQPETPLCTTCYLTADHLGSTRLMTDGASGAAVALHDYLPFGEEIPSGIGGRSSLYGTDSPRQRFTGKERDAETGLDYFGARYLSSAQGRWTSPDQPFADQHLADPQSWNLYAYTTNNPLRFIDDNGGVKHDANGNVVFEQSSSGTFTFLDNATTKLTDGTNGTLSISWQANFGRIYADDGTPIEASKATSDMSVVVRDANGNVVQQGGSGLLPAGFSNTADCHGTTFADGQVWIGNDQVPAIIRGDNYSRTKTPTTGDVGVYTQNGSLSTTVHSVGVSAVNPRTGAVAQVASKGGITPRTQTTPAAGWSDPKAKLTYYHKKPPPPPPPKPKRQGQN
jgi:RHS repeat-associated protein